MRGEPIRQTQLFHCLDVESRIPGDHPIRAVKRLCDEVLKSLSCALEGMYSETGRPSVPPERLLKGQVLIALYSVRSDRMFCERLNWDMLFRWFLDMGVEEAGFGDGENFHGEKRSNDTHESKTDGEARLYRKGPGKEAKLCYSMNLLADNRHGLVVDLAMELATGRSEREAAMKLLNRQRDVHGVAVKSVGADKAYHCADFVQGLRQLRIRPHVACRDDRKVAGLDGRTTRHRSYRLSQRARKLVEQPFGWMKAFAGFRKTRFRGRAKSELAAQLTAAAYNLLRIAKLQTT